MTPRHSTTSIFDTIARAFYNQCLGGFVNGLSDEASVLQSD